jgi:protein TonB
MNFDIALPGTIVFVLLALIFLAYVILPLLIRKMMAGRSGDGSLTEKYRDSAAAPFLGRSKYPEVDVFKRSTTHFGIGAVTAVVVSILIFSWTVFIKDTGSASLDEDWEEEIEMEIPRTAEPPPPPPPPPPPVIEEVPDEVEI